MKSLSNLAQIRKDIKRKRVSSYDKTGANKDNIQLKPNESYRVCDIQGAGIIKHIWMTIASDDPDYLRKLVIRMWWDDELHETPSVETPIGDFFGIGHGIVKNFWSLPLCMSPRDGRGFNCYFPMPFARGARMEVTNETGEDLRLYFYVDYEAYPSLADDYGRFHALWRRENPTKGWGDSQSPFEEDVSYQEEIWGTPNLKDVDNYLILDAEGKGHYVGCHLDIDCFVRGKNDWYGEGDDMIMIDGELWPPRLHGTGTEDYFNTAYSPEEEFCTPYHGITVYSGTEEWPWKGKNSLYRFHIEDPIYFERSIRVSIEHGHANNLGNDYSSTAYWYQTEPHRSFGPFSRTEKRLPRPD